jgi:glycosyltransferase involved in cell wall biosynthesis
VPEPDYSIVIPAWNEEESLPLTLETLRLAMAVVPLEGEIVVCNNDSTDGTASVARRAGASVVHEPERQIARARNTGARAARGRHLVFVDADTLVEPPLLRTALGLLEAGEACGGGALMEMDVGDRSAARRAVRFWNGISRRLGVAAGSFVYVRREAWEAVGGFPESVYAGEEVWFSRAVKRWGRSRGKPFRVIESPPVRTSGRKVRWFSTWAMTGQFLLLALCPPLARSRWFCFTWYRRPASRS